MVLKIVSRQAVAAPVGLRQVGVREVRARSHFCGGTIFIVEAIGLPVSDIPIPTPPGSGVVVSSPLPCLSTPQYSPHPLPQPRTLRFFFPAQTRSELFRRTCRKWGAKREWCPLPTSQPWGLALLPLLSLWNRYRRNVVSPGPGLTSCQAARLPSREG